MKRMVNAPARTQTLHLLCIGLCSLLPIRAGADDHTRLDLRAQMPLACQISVESAPDALNLDLTRSASDLLVASIREVCNAPDGYTVTLSSLGAGRLRLEPSAGQSTDGEPGIPYELRYGGERASLQGSQRISEARSRTGASGVRKQMQISYRSPRDASGGAYSDVLVLTITPR